MRRPVPTVRAVLLACLGVVLVLVARGLGRPDLAGLGAGLLLLPVLAWVLAAVFAGRGSGRPLLRSVHGERLPHEPLQVTVERDGAGQATGPGPGHELVPGQEETAIRSVPGAPLNYTFTPPWRGVFRLGPFVAAGADPLHLTKREAPADPGTPLTVGPAPVAPETGTALRDLLSSSVAGGQELDTTVRPFQEGDPFRRIHWPLSARAGQVMVRPDVHGFGGDPVVLLDRNPAHYEGAVSWVQTEQGRRRSSVDFDAAVSGASAALAALRSRGSGAGLCAFPAEGGEGMHDDAAVLASVRPATSSAAPPSGDSGGLVVMTGIPGEEAAAWPRTRSERSALVVLHGPAGSAPPPAVTDAWARAGWRWVLVPVAA